jgi:hypothetical protein
MGGSKPQGKNYCKTLEGKATLSPAHPHHPDTTYRELCNRTAQMRQSIGCAVVHSRAIGPEIASHGLGSVSQLFCP